MPQNSKIEWTDATWNPVTGCTKVSPGCSRCYAERIAERFRGVAAHPFEHGFDLQLRPERLTDPLRWTKPKMVFVNSMSDLFHEQIPEAYIARVFETMKRAEQHVFQILTKRSERLATIAGLLPWPPNVWVGVSVENQWWTRRVAHLREVPAAVRFLSCEPLLGPLDLDLSGIDWVIAGGESGPQARRMKPEWVTSIQQQCQSAEVPFFFKQWGAFDEEGKRTGKKRAGRMLSGKTWSMFPVEQRRGFAHP